MFTDAAKEADEDGDQELVEAIYLTSEEAKAIRRRGTYEGNYVN